MEQKKKFWLEGLIPAVFTPMSENGDVSLGPVSPYCEYLLDRGIKAVFVNGGTGEGTSLTAEERKKVLEEWIRVSNNRLVIVAHIGGLNIKESQKLAEHAQAVGSDAIASLPSLYFKPSNVETLVDQCASIAKCADQLPFYYYHIPGYSGVNLNMEDFTKLALQKIPTFHGIKYSSQDLEDMLGVSNCGVNILFGCDPQLLSGIVTGAHGAIGTLYNVMPKVYLRLLYKLEENDIDGARKEQTKTQIYIRVARKYGAKIGGPVAAMKQIMGFLGIDVGPPRSPMRSFTEEEKKDFKAELEAIGFFDWQ